MVRVFDLVPYLWTSNFIVCDNVNHMNNVRWYNLAYISPGEDTDQSANLICLITYEESLHPATLTTHRGPSEG